MTKETKQLKLKETDNFVCADKEKGVIKTYGKKAIHVQKHNEKNKGHHIPIIRESICLQLIERNQPPRP